MEYLVQLGLILACSGTQLYEFNSANFTPVVTGINLGNPVFPWNNCYLTNIISTSSSLGAITWTSLNSSGTISATSETLTNTSNQLVLGTTNTTTLSATAPAASRTYTIPDSGANSSFVLTDGTQTINGSKTFSSRIAITPTSNQLVLGTTNTITLSTASVTAPRTYYTRCFHGICN